MEIVRSEKKENNIQAYDQEFLVFSYHYNSWWSVLQANMSVLMVKMSYNQDNDFDESEGSVLTGM